ncbi:MAG: hypothetical protein IT367_06785 [Candidatus Hydrogenedentes bacterium]|nr:hypothetical protein [Candidatus Hydrogenedentota bacterium]
MNASTGTIPAKLHQIVAAWFVHVLTASTAVIGLFALREIEHKHWAPFFGLLALTTLIDSFDGALARYFRVKERVPNIDGALLDNIVDYFTYALVPAAFVYESGYFAPLGAIAGASMIALSSAYQFSQIDAKTEDHCFKGWPSYWNIVALYIVLLDLSPEANFRIILFFTVLVFVPVKYVYPSRTTHYRKLNILLALLWGCSMSVLIVQIENPSRWLLWLSLIYVTYYMLMSFWLTLREEKRKASN